MNWIKLKDKLPIAKEVGQKVLLYRLLNEGQLSMSYSIHETQMVKYCNPEETWWQPLPEPPKP